MDYTDIKKCKRIMIMGNTASGKSTLAKQLSEKLEIEVHFLDAIAHEPNSRWIRTPISEFIKKHTKLTKNKKWIIEGNYSATLEDRLKLTDLIIFIDINRFLAVFNFIKRRFSKNNRYGAPNGCKDALKISQLKYFLLVYPKRAKKRRESLKDRDNVIYIKSFRDLLKFKKSIGLETKGSKL